MALGMAVGAMGLATPAIARAFALPVAPRTDHIVVSKSLRVLELREKGEVVKRFRIALGFTPEGKKTASGDGRTPEGLYWIDRRNPRSEYFLSIGISYPNADDVARARALGRSPGGDIFIHGQPMRPREIRAAKGKKDWTAGCIAVANEEIEEIWAMTPLGTPITILA
ncbi:L,D-transpeptidase family protein [Amaricoccus sp.]|uniref:L,D-transpeptidase family protein n=1 Tax=Amaricoccus sp. TaxID=1872485 RepID=UPI0025B92D3F|nr:L,D-transpeptidase family protein [Amaricoccus sp.]